MASISAKGNFHNNDSVGVYDELKQRGVKPSIGVVLSALKVCRSKNDVHTGRRIHQDVLQNGDYANIFVRNILEDMYCRAGNMPEARRVFESMKHHDVVSWNSIILGYARAGQGDLALEFLSRMQDEGFTPNHVTILAALKACQSLCEKSSSCLQNVRAVHSQALKLSPSGLELFVASSLVAMYAKCGSMAEARNVFDTMKTHDVVSWTALIHGYAQVGEAELALEFYARMERHGNVKPDRITVLAALKACVVLAEKEEARFVEGKLVKVDILERSRGIHLQATRNRVEQDLVVATALVDLYSKCGDTICARRVFEGMEEKDVVSWTSIIAGYAQGGEEEEALALYERMKEEGCRPDGVTYVAVLQACGSLAALQTGRKIHSEIHDAGMETHLVVANSLVDFYGNCGCMEDAKEVFERIQDKDLVSWSSLLTGYSSQGDARSVFELYERMQKEDRLEPDEVTFLSVLNACSHAGMVERGKACFREMVERLGVQPGIQHYTCMVDMLGRRNKLREAVEVVKAMPCEANEVTWTALLSSALRWKNVSVGEEAFQALAKVAGLKASACVVMWRIYANAGMWEDAQRIQDMRRYAGSQEMALGLSSWIDQHGTVHKFYSL